MQTQQSWYSMLQVLLPLKEPRNGKEFINLRLHELLEKANPGILIALCGNKIDLENRQVNKEVYSFLN